MAPPKSFNPDLNQKQRSQATIHEKVNEPQVLENWLLTSQVSHILGETK
jgi:hypothetical protein